MPTREKDQAHRWPKVLLKLSRLYARMRSQALAHIAIVEAERAVRRKIKAAGAGVSRTTKNQNE